MGCTDPKLEDSLRVRLDFMLLTGLDLHCTVLDDTIHCRFRNARVKAGAYDGVHAEVGRQIVGHGLKDLAMMPVTKEWPPFEIMRDVEMINTLISHRWSFQKSVLRNLLTKAPIASAILTDLAEPIALFVPDPQSDGDTLQELITTAYEGRYPHPNRRLTNIGASMQQSRPSSRPSKLN